MKTPSKFDIAAQAIFRTLTFALTAILFIGLVMHLGGVFTDYEFDHTFHKHMMWYLNTMMFLVLLYNRNRLKFW